MEAILYVSQLNGSTAFSFDEMSVFEYNGPCTLLCRGYRVKAVPTGTKSRWYFFPFERCISTSMFRALPLAYEYYHSFR